MNKKRKTILRYPSSYPSEIIPSKIIPPEDSRPKAMLTTMHRAARASVLSFIIALSFKYMIDFFRPCQRTSRYRRRSASGTMPPPVAQTIWTAFFRASSPNRAAYSPSSCVRTQPKKPAVADGSTKSFSRS